jgi:hypothetical protein
MFETRQHQGYCYVKFNGAIRVPIACIFSRRAFIACPPQKQLIHSVSWNNSKLKGLSHKINLTFNAMNIDTDLGPVRAHFNVQTMPNN